VATLLAADRVLMTITGLLNSQRFMNTFSYVVSSVGSSIAQGDAFTAIRDKLCLAGGFMDKYKACIPSNVNALELWFQVIYPTRYIKYIRGDLSTGSLGSGAAWTSNLTQVITRRCDRAGRKFHSSLYLPLDSTNDAAEDGLLTGGQRTILNQFAALVDDEIVVTSPAVELTPSIFHKPLTVLPDPITDAYAQAESRVMRRRTVGRGI
jgi:hypothetical protein